MGLTNIPIGWISETELAAATGVADEDRSKFHRNLVNWRQHWLLPKFFDGLVVPQVRPSGNRPGNEAWHPPITLPTVRRINEMRHQRPRDMDEWVWQLWFEAYPIDIVGWCRERISWHVGAISSVDKEALELTATRKPGKRSDPRRTFYRRLMWRGWAAFMIWLVNVASGARPPQSIFDPVSSPLKALGRAIGLSPSIVRKGLEGSPIEDLSVAQLLAILDEVQPTELEKVRQDCWVLSQARRDGGFIGLILSATWRRVDCRACILPGLIALHRSPDHQDSLLDALRRHLRPPGTASP